MIDETTIARELIKRAKEQIEEMAVDIDDRHTPPRLFTEALARWGPFSVDVAASASNALCARYFTREDDGLRKSWDGERVWCNPPFSDLAPWCAKAWDSSADIVVMLLPANRTEQPWWHRHIEPFRDKVGSRLSTHFTSYRPRFSSPSGRGVGSPKFGCVFAVWGPRPAGSGA